MIDMLTFWLLEDVPVIGDDRILVQTFKDAENLDILFTFVFDPHFFPLNTIVRSALSHKIKID